ncbi:MAG TPA: enoyl-CoA hydratase-related protein [Beijerinckiaceae bacterium]|jgi:enoyl-CoA hydratase|nr:enoyl-CoA hydratase-related protein [Beijerinckiaceae bacterium]
MREQYETLALSEPAGHVLQVTLNRPNVANAMNTQMGLDLLDVFTDLFARPDAYRAVVVTGAGERAFCAGGDLKERQGMSDETWQAQHLIFERMIRAVLEAPMPVIAAVNGAAYAGGCEISLGCDFIYAARTARFALTEVTIGIMPGAGGTQTLPRAVGLRRAKEILLTGRPFTAEQAYEWGMVNRLCEPGSVVQDAVETATVIAGNAPISIRQAKRSMHYGVNMSLADGMLFEIEAYNRMVPTDDRREGIASFNEKRKPVFKGR